jgi:hypothetical protein
MCRQTRHVFTSHTTCNEPLECDETRRNAFRFVSWGSRFWQNTFTGDASSSSRLEIRSMLQPALRTSRVKFLKSLCHGNEWFRHWHEESFDTFPDDKQFTRLAHDTSGSASLQGSRNWQKLEQQNAAMKPQRGTWNCPSALWLTMYQAVETY